jgi:superfamily II DNA/RNA helicase
LLTEEDEQENGPIRQYPLRALILCPTRELAMQVSMEFSKLIKTTLDGDDNDLSTQSVIKCGTIVGGLAEQKQKRVLDVKRPPVLVATPGRLWDLVSVSQYYLNFYCNNNMICTLSVKNTRTLFENLHLSQSMFV